jgi:hypothetical protein
LGCTIAIPVLCGHHKEAPADDQEKENKKKKTAKKRTGNGEQQNGDLRGRATVLLHARRRFRG